MASARLNVLYPAGWKMTRSLTCHLVVGSTKLGGKVFGRETTTSAAEAGAGAAS